MVNYFRMLIPNFSTKTSPLTKLLRKDSQYKKGPLPEKAQKAFQRLKQLLCEKPVIAYPHADKQFILSVDAAVGDDDQEGGLGAILSQVQDGYERVISYASRSLAKHEKNYSPFLLEMQAATWGIDYYHHYLYGSQGFILRTDHKPLEGLTKIHKKTLLRLQQQMSEYRFKIEYRKGTENGGPDALSRNPLPAIALLNLEPNEAQRLQRCDPFLLNLQKFRKQIPVPQQTLRKFRIPQLNKHIFKIKKHYHIRINHQNFHQRTPFIAPPVMIPEILKAAHNNAFAGHGGIFKTYHRILEHYWWPHY